MLFEQRLKMIAYGISIGIDVDELKHYFVNVVYNSSYQKELCIKHNEDTYLIVRTNSIVIGGKGVYDVIWNEVSIDTFFQNSLIEDQVISTDDLTTLRDIQQCWYGEIGRHA